MLEFVNRLWPSPFRQRAHEGRRDAKAVGKEVAKDVAKDVNPMRLLIVTQDDGYYLSVHAVAGRCGWETRLARTIERGLQMLDEFPAPVAIYDWPATGNDWRADVDRLTARPGHPCVLLASRVDDEYLGAELVRHGGFAVIPRTADAERLIRNIQFAGFFRRSSRIGQGG